MKKNLPMNICIKNNEGWQHMLGVILLINNYLYINIFA